MIRQNPSSNHALTPMMSKNGNVQFSCSSDLKSNILLAAQPVGWNLDNCIFMISTIFQTFLTRPSTKYQSNFESFFLQKKKKNKKKRKGESQPYSIFFPLSRTRNRSGSSYTLVDLFRRCQVFQNQVEWKVFRNFDHFSLQSTQLFKI
jgi:hypothetical protein